MFTRAVAEAQHFVAAGQLPAGMTNAFVPGTDAPVLLPPAGPPKKAKAKAAAAKAPLPQPAAEEEGDGGKRKRKRPARIADAGWPETPAVPRRVRVGRLLGLLPPARHT